MPEKDSPPSLDYEYASDMLQTLSETLGDVIKNRDVLETARKNLGGFAKSESILWRLEIDRGHPLRFEESKNDRGAKLIPEICCRIDGGLSPESPLQSMELELRLWSNDPDLIYRRDWDSPRVEQLLNSKERRERVILRYHFDRGKETKDGEPAYHVNHGGVSGVEELCWFPTELRGPRLPYVPMDLVLACELVVSSFFPEKFILIQQKPEWRQLVYTSEYVLLRPMLDICTKRCKSTVIERALNKAPTILNSIWLQKNPDGASG